MKKMSRLLFVAGLICLGIAIAIPQSGKAFHFSWPSKEANNHMKSFSTSYRTYSVAYRSLSLADSINLQMDMMGIDIRPTNKDKIYLSYQLKAKSKKDPIEVIEGSELVIRIKNAETKDANMTLLLPRRLYQNLTIDADMSTVNINEVETNHLVINADMSTLDLAQTSFMSGDIYSDMSSIHLRDISDYGLNIHSDMSSVKVNGKTVSGSYTREGTRHLQIEADMGDINIE